MTVFTIRNSNMWKLKKCGFPIGILEVLLGNAKMEKFAKPMLKALISMLINGRLLYFAFTDSATSVLNTHKPKVPLQQFDCAEFLHKCYSSQMRIIGFSSLKTEFFGNVPSSVGLTVG